MAVRPNDATDIGAVLEADALPIDRVGSTAANKTTPGALQTFVLQAATKALRCLRAIIGANIVDDTFATVQVEGPVKVQGVGFTDPLPRTGAFGAMRAIGNTRNTISLISEMYHDSNFSGGAVALYRSMANGSIIQAGLQMGAVAFGTRDATAAYTPATIAAFAEENFIAGAAYGCSLRFYTNPLGSPTNSEKMRLSPSGQLLLGVTTSAFDAATFQMAGRQYIIDPTMTYPLPGYPAAGSLLIAGLTNQSSGIIQSIFSDTLTQAPGITFTHNAANGTYPLTGSILGRITAGWLQAAGGSYAGTGIIIAADADIVQGVTHDCHIRFSTTQGANAAVERMRIKPAGTLNLSAVAVYADNATAIAGGLVAGDVYRTATGQLMIVF